jgi:hypothetical protein
MKISARLKSSDPDGSQAAGLSLRIQAVKKSLTGAGNI